ncbi:hypothetical protein Q8A73_013511 [Channa argus]|nr:hypothetical protein Q8A73_013511 [Channa argus]
MEPVTEDESTDALSCRLTSSSFTRSQTDCRLFPSRTASRCVSSRRCVCRAPNPNSASFSFSFPPEHQMLQPSTPREQFLGGHAPTCSVRLGSCRRVFPGNRVDLDGLHSRFRIPSAAVRTAGAELSSDRKTGSSG